ncbi:MAG: GGDEF domain-containing protein [Gammaproteobacteria bacterium]|nr:GGDEF domain-containing protein [Gammaproteobacteria bacterium]NNC68640.1 GGDEF domain-containing protein [Gammaproteobacteria bacterium]
MNVDTQNSEDKVVENKSSGLFSLPAAFIKKLYTHIEPLSGQPDQMIVDSEVHDDNRSEDVNEVSESLRNLISTAQALFENHDAFGSVKNMANEITDLSESNHVLFSLANVLKKTSKKYVIEKQELVFELPLEILKKFKFSKDYQDRNITLQNQCKNIQSITDLNACLQAIYELFYSVYQDAYADKEELENFLFNIGAQISRIGDKLHSVAEEQVSDLKIQGDLNIKMNDAVCLISKNIISGNDLASLKQTVKVQLDTLQNIVEEERQIVKAQETRVHKSVKALANQVNELKLEAQELRHKVQSEREQALRDPLTDLYNRQAYNEKIAEIIAEKEKYNDNLSLLIWDIDHFKKFNDLYGHVVGDKVLKTVADKFTKLLKENYFLARYGGEEFAMLVPELSLEKAREYADYIRREISNIAFMVKGKKVQITISCGVASIQANDNAQSIFERADKALYVAKEKGRNCVNTYCTM